MAKSRSRSRCGRSKSGKARTIHTTASGRKYVIRVSGVSGRPYKKYCSVKKSRSRSGSK